jgi:1,4-dihydroxy-2-naphthoate octaprenyltransferase
MIIPEAGYWVYFSGYASQFIIRRLNLYLMANNPKSTTPSSLKKTSAWLLAVRPRTLPAATAPVVVGSGVACLQNQFELLPALAALVGALLLQIGANLANDVFDYHKGADTAQRLGPTRVTQAGLLTPQQVFIGMWVTFGLASLAGVYLAWAAGWPVIAMGIASILAAIAYTGGPYPLGYNGLGEVFVFIFFGPVAVLGTYYVQALSISPLAIWSSIPVGLLITAILVVNNLRDIATDQAAGKHTLAVRLGARATRLEYLVLVSIAYLLPAILSLTGTLSWLANLVWLSLPLAVSMVNKVNTLTGRPLNSVLAGTGQLTLVHSFLYAAGLALTRAFLY